MSKLKKLLILATIATSLLTATVASAYSLPSAGSTGSSPTTPKFMYAGQHIYLDKPTTTGIINFLGYNVKRYQPSTINDSNINNYTNQVTINGINKWELPYNSAMVPIVSTKYDLSYDKNTIRKIFYSASYEFDSSGKYVTDSTVNTHNLLPNNSVFRLEFIPVYALPDGSIGEAVGDNVVSCFIQLAPVPIVMEADNGSYDANQTMVATVRFTQPITVSMTTKLKLNNGAILTSDQSNYSNVTSINYTGSVGTSEINPLKIVDILDVNNNIVTNKRYSWAHSSAASECYVVWIIPTYNLGSENYNATTTGLLNMAYANTAATDTTYKNRYGFTKIDGASPISLYAKVNTNASPYNTSVWHSDHTGLSIYYSTVDNGSGVKQINWAGDKTLEFPLNNQTIVRGIPLSTKNIRPNSNPSVFKPDGSFTLQTKPAGTSVSLPQSLSSIFGEVEVQLLGKFVAYDEFNKFIEYGFEAPESALMVDTKAPTLVSSERNGTYKIRLNVSELGSGVQKIMIQQKTTSGSNAPTNQEIYPANCTSTTVGDILQVDANLTYSLDTYGGGQIGLIDKVGNLRYVDVVKFTCPPNVLNYTPKGIVYLTQNPVSASIPFNFTIEDKDSSKLDFAYFSTILGWSTGNLQKTITDAGFMAAGGKSITLPITYEDIGKDIIFNDLSLEIKDYSGPTVDSTRQIPLSATTVVVDKLAPTVLYDTEVIDGITYVNFQLDDSTSGIGSYTLGRGVTGTGSVNGGLAPMTATPPVSSTTTGYTRKITEYIKYRVVDNDSYVLTVTDNAGNSVVYPFNIKGASGDPIPVFKYDNEWAQNIKTSKTDNVIIIQQFDAGVSQNIEMYYRDFDVPSTSVSITLKKPDGTEISSQSGSFLFNPLDGMSTASMNIKYVTAMQNYFILELTTAEGTLTNHIYLLPDTLYNLQLPEVLSDDNLLVTYSEYAPTILTDKITTTHYINEDSNIYTSQGISPIYYGTKDFYKDRGMYFSPTKGDPVIIKEGDYAGYTYNPIGASQLLVGGKIPKSYLADATSLSIGSVVSTDFGIEYLYSTLREADYEIALQLNPATKTESFNPEVFISKGSKTISYSDDVPVNTFKGYRFDYALVSKSGYLGDWNALSNTELKDSYSTLVTANNVITKSYPSVSNTIDPKLITKSGTYLLALRVTSPMNTQYLAFAEYKVLFDKDSKNIILKNSSAYSINPIYLFNNTINEMVEHSIPITTEFGIRAYANSDYVYLFNRNRSNVLIVFNKSLSSPTTITLDSDVVDMCFIEGIPYIATKNKLYSFNEKTLSEITLPITGTYAFLGMCDWKGDLITVTSDSVQQWEITGGTAYREILLPTGSPVPVAVASKNLAIFIIGNNKMVILS